MVRRTERERAGPPLLRSARAARRQFERLEYFTTFWDYSNDRSIELAARLAGLTPNKLNRLFFTSGGSEGNEAALKMPGMFTRGLVDAAVSGSFRASTPTTARATARAA
jgi:4-aminobutyrate aminotransferase-like enzyme